MYCMRQAQLQNGKRYSMIKHYSSLLQGLPVWPAQALTALGHPEPWGNAEGCITDCLTGHAARGTHRRGRFGGFLFGSLLGLCCLALLGCFLGLGVLWLWGCVMGRVSVLVAAACDSRTSSDVCSPPNKRCFTKPSTTGRLYVRPQSVHVILLLAARLPTA